MKRFEFFEWSKIKKNLFRLFGVRVKNSLSKNRFDFFQFEMTVKRALKSGRILVLFVPVDV